MPLGLIAGARARPRWHDESSNPPRAAASVVLGIERRSRLRHHWWSVPSRSDAMLFDCRPCGFHAWGVDRRTGRSSSLIELRIAAYPCPRCGRRSRAAVTRRLIVSVLIGLLVGLVPFYVTEHALLSATAALLAAIVIGLFTVPRKRSIRFLESWRLTPRDERV